MAARIPPFPSNQLLSSSQFSEAISIVSPSQLPAVRPHPRAGNSPRQPTLISANDFAHQRADGHQSQSASRPGSPTPTRPIPIISPQRRYLDRLALMGFERPRGYVGPLKGEPRPGIIHHRADDVKDYHLKGTYAWEGFEQRRLELSQAEIGKIDRSWAANGGGVILDFGVKKRRGGPDVLLSTIMEEREKEMESEKKKEKRKRDGKGRRRDGK